MARKKVGEVAKPTAYTPSYYPVYWDEVTKKVYVGNEFAGTASVESIALHVGDYYCSTGNRINK
jgi:hypothetical protein